MKLLDKLTDDAAQTFTLVTDTGQQVKFSLRYLPAIEAWRYNLEWGNYKINGERLVASPNITRAYRDLLPFGLAVISSDNLDPLYINDFISGRIKIYLLIPDDVTAIESEFYA